LNGQGLTIQVISNSKSDMESHLVKLLQYILHFVVATVVSVTILVRFEASIGLQYYRCLFIVLHPIDLSVVLLLFSSLNTCTSLFRTVS
jgi:hypothetical protein